LPRQDGGVAQRVAVTRSGAAAPRPRLPVAMMADPAKHDRRAVDVSAKRGRKYIS